MPASASPWPRLAWQRLSRPCSWAFRLAQTLCRLGHVPALGKASQRVGARLSAQARGRLCGREFYKDLVAAAARLHQREISRPLSLTLSVGYLLATGLQE